jgi:hypothetical protein
MTTIHRATIIKDRFGVLDGKTGDNPGFAFFKPYIDLLSPGTHTAVPSEAAVLDVDESGDGEWQREKRNRTIFSEEIQGLLVAAFPSQGVEDKKNKAEALFRVLDTRSWTAVENTKADKLKAALQNLPQVLAELKGAPPAKTMEDDIAEVFGGEKKTVKVGKEKVKA